MKTNKKDRSIQAYQKFIKVLYQLIYRSKHEFMSSDPCVQDHVKDGIIRGRLEALLDVEQALQKAFDE